MVRGDQRNASADEDWHDMDVEFIDLAGVEEGGDQLSAAHHPDMLARRLAKAARERFYGLGYELGARDCFLLPGLPREHVIRDLLIEHAVFDVQEARAQS